MKLRAGDTVVVRSSDEILATLDERGCLDALPFMPEMLRFCGQRFRVQAVAHKTCDTIENKGGRRLHDAVHLEELRCDGASHGNCQAACLLFWKSAWLRKVTGAQGDERTDLEQRVASRCTPAALEAATRSGSGADGEPLYSCQATKLLAATRPLAWWNFAQYLRDIRSGNVSVRRAARVLFLASLRAWTDWGFAYRISTRIYDWVHRKLTGRPAPLGKGGVRDGEVTPTATLGLRPGEWVRIKPASEIAATLNSNSKNRGLWFDEEMVQHCGSTFRVAGRVERIINEKTGAMLQMKTPCIVLDGTVCTGSYTRLRLLCPRRIVSYWREIWLERVPARPPDPSASGAP